MAVKKAKKASKAEKAAPQAPADAVQENAAAPSEACDCEQ